MVTWVIRVMEVKWSSVSQCQMEIFTWVLSHFCPLKASQRASLGSLKTASGEDALCAPVSEITEVTSSKAMHHTSICFQGLRSRHHPRTSFGDGQNKDASRVSCGLDASVNHIKTNVHEGHIKIHLFWTISKWELVHSKKYDSKQCVKSCVTIDKEIQ